MVRTRLLQQLLVIPEIRSQPPSSLVTTSPKFPGLTQSFHRAWLLLSRIKAKKTHLLPVSVNLRHAALTSIVARLEASEGT